MDFKLDTTGDLAIEDDAIVLVDGIEAVTQDVTIRLKFFLGDWFLDQRLGVPYYQKILGTKPRMFALKGIFKKAILSTPGIDSITDFEISYDTTTRLLSVSFRTEYQGEPLEYSKELIV